MYKKYGNKFMCFSPPVMLITFLFEFGAALYIMWRYNVNLVTRLIIIVLICLGTFQLAEYMVCGGFGMHGGDWARLGYISITALPALGLHLITAIAGKKLNLLIYPSYAVMVAFMLYFVLTPGVINTLECRPNYTIFAFDETTSVFYDFWHTFYHVWLCCLVRDHTYFHGCTKNIKNKATP